MSNKDDRARWAAMLRGHLRKKHKSRALAYTLTQAQLSHDRIHRGKRQDHGIFEGY